MKIKKAVILAGGLGTRFFPATKSQPKEMLPIVDKPCIQYLVEEANKSGIKEIIFVVSEGKEAIKNHFTHSEKISKQLKSRKKDSLLKQIKEIESLAKFSFVTQPAPLGDGNAILCAKKHLKSEPFVVLFGDDIYDSTTPPTMQMIRQYEKLKTPIVALTQIDPKDSHKYGMIKGTKKSANSHQILELKEKPRKAPSNLAITGKYIVTPELLKTLEQSKPTHADGEHRLIDGMIQYLQTSPIHGVEIKGHRFDTGDKLGYLKAVVHFGLKHADLKQDFLEHLKGRKF